MFAGYNLSDQENQWWWSRSPDDILDRNGYFQRTGSRWRNLR